jgi:hypothetical protein
MAKQAGEVSYLTCFLPLSHELACKHTSVLGYGVSIRKYCKKGTFWVMKQCGLVQFGAKDRGSMFL